MGGVVGVDEGVEVGVDGGGVVVVEGGLGLSLDGLDLHARLLLEGGLGSLGNGLGGGGGGEGLLVVGVKGGGVAAGGGDVGAVEDPEAVLAGRVLDGVGLAVVADVGVLWGKNWV